MFRHIKDAEIIDYQIRGATDKYSCENETLDEQRRTRVEQRAEDCKDADHAVAFIGVDRQDIEQESRRIYFGFGGAVLAVCRREVVFLDSYQIQSNRGCESFGDASFTDIPKFRSPRSLACFDC